MKYATSVMTYFIMLNVLLLTAIVVASNDAREKRKASIESELKKQIEELEKRNAFLGNDARKLIQNANHSEMYRVECQENLKALLKSKSCGECSYIDYQKDIDKDSTPYIMSGVAPANCPKGYIAWINPKPGSTSWSYTCMAVQ